MKYMRIHTHIGGYVYTYRWRFVRILGFTSGITPVVDYFSLDYEPMSAIYKSELMMKIAFG